MSTPKHAVITSFLGKTKDRFHEYNEVKTVEEKFQTVSKLAGYSGVEIIFPYEVSNAAEIKALLAKYNLQVAAVNVNVKAEPEFRSGGLTSPRKEIRDKAVKFIKDSKDFARELGANKVTCCPLGDGYEFSFHCNYAEMWRHMVDTLGTAGAYCPEIPLFIEYKPSETRGKCFVDTAAKTLHLLHEINLPGMGVTIDYGHSKYGQENPAEVVSLVAESDYPYYIHINDNDGKWDWDFMAGTKNYLEYVEFLYYLQEYKYTDFLTSDTSPTRWDIPGTFEINSRLTNKIWHKLESLDRDGFKKLIAQGDFIKTWKFIETEILGLADKK